MATLGLDVFACKIETIEELVKHILIEDSNRRELRAAKAKEMALKKLTWYKATIKSMLTSPKTISPIILRKRKAIALFASLSQA